MKNENIVTADLQLLILHVKFKLQKHVNSSYVFQHLQFKLQGPSDTSQFKLSFSFLCATIKSCKTDSKFAQLF